MTDYHGSSRAWRLVLWICAGISVALVTACWAFWFVTRPLQCWENISEIKLAFYQQEVDPASLRGMCPVTSSPYFISKSALLWARKGSRRPSKPEPVVWDSRPHRDGFYTIGWSDLSLTKVRKLPPDLPPGIPFDKLAAQGCGERQYAP
ncbi:MAG: hypothetical protein HRF45_09620 [Fimbriimonadia bacterium]|jgi:hypothetical protein